MNSTVSPHVPTHTTERLVQLEPGAVEAYAKEVLCVEEPDVIFKDAALRQSDDLDAVDRDALARQPLAFVLDARQTQQLCVRVCAAHMIHIVLSEELVLGMPALQHDLILLAVRDADVVAVLVQAQLQVRVCACSNLMLIADNVHIRPV